MRKKLAFIEKQHANEDITNKLDALNGVISKLEQGVKEEVKSTQLTISETLTAQLQSTGKMLGDHLVELGKAQTREIENVKKSTDTLTQSNDTRLDSVRKTVNDRVQDLQNTLTQQLNTTTNTLVNTVGKLGDTQTTATDKLIETIGEFGKTQKQRLEDVTKATNTLTQSNENSIENVRKTINERLQSLQNSNDSKLDQMRKTVDEQLQSTLEKRLTESFNIVSERLEAVTKGLGAMQELASDVDSLQKVLANVSQRGALGEVQLGSILEQILTPDQYEKNVQPHTGSERVEYAIRLPGENKDLNSHVWLPIDAKFPTADYERLLDAAENADKEAEEQAINALMRTIRRSAQDIQKYIQTPHTTEFAIMFLPTEGLYSEVLRKPGEVQKLLQDSNIIVTGPTNLAALLMSIRVGFRTLAIQEHSSEIWNILAAVKTEFEKFGELMTKLKKQLNTASNTVDKTSVRTRAMARHLKEVEQLPPEIASEQLGLPNTESDGGLVDLSDSQEESTTHI